MNEIFTPENLSLWEKPSHYFGAAWPCYYVFLGRSRDSDCLENCNFTEALKAIGGESETVEVVRESHWAVGWVEWIAIHQDDAEALRKADAIEARLNDYPVVNEDALSMAEIKEADEIWRNCYNAKERSEYVRKHRDQFNFRGFDDARSCLRGDYFAGYASELIYR